MERSGQTRCEYCWHPIGKHNQGCPVKIGTPQAMATWERARQQGFADDTDGLKPTDWRYHDATCILGYRVGQAEIDDLVDTAAQVNYSYSL